MNTKQLTMVILVQIKANLEVHIDVLGAPSLRISVFQIIFAQLSIFCFHPPKAVSIYHYNNYFLHIINSSCIWILSNTPSLNFYEKKMVSTHAHICYINNTT